MAVQINHIHRIKSTVTLDVAGANKIHLMDVVAAQGFVDVLQRLKIVGFWIQAATAGITTGLMSPSPRVDVPTLSMFIAALRSRSWVAPHLHVHIRSRSFRSWLIS